jgi:orotate phosphoribosyltransferase
MLMSPSGDRSSIEPVHPMGKQMYHRERLKVFLVERSVRLGDFTLASGARSDYYVDARRTTMTAEGQVLIGRLGLEAIRGAGWGATHVGGMTLGADPISYAIANESFRDDGSTLDGFTVRKQPKGHGTGQQIEGGLPENARVVMIEDSMSTGGSTLKAIKVIRDYGCTIVGVLTIVDREMGGAAAMADEGLELVSLFTGEELKEAARAE